MKVKHEENGFKKIIITIETKKEATVLQTILSSISGNGEIRDIIDDLSDKLSDFDISYIPGMVKNVLELKDSD